MTSSGNAEMQNLWKLFERDSNSIYVLPVIQSKLSVSGTSPPLPLGNFWREKGREEGAALLEVWGQLLGSKEVGKTEVENQGGLEWGESDQFHCFLAV